MATLRASRAAGAWKLDLTRGPAPDAAAMQATLSRGRAQAWRLAHALGPDASPWDIEYFHACLGAREMDLGYASEIASACDGAAPDGHIVTCAVPEAGIEPRSAAVALAGRGHAVEGAWRRAAIDRLAFTLAAGGAFLALCGYVLRASLQRLRSGGRTPSDAQVGLCVHGEWTNRTRHALAAIAAHGEPGFVVCLGRLKQSAAAVAAQWAAQGVKPRCVINPLSIGSTIAALPRMAGLLAEGFAAAPRRPVMPSLREHVAMVFRVLLGAASARWWSTHGPAARTIVFGHTGTADTVMLERSMQQRNARTVHLVHGLATGPNFLAFSDRAVFRSGHDAAQYRELASYAACEHQDAPRPAVRRGRSGIFLLTNLAHPMNPRFAAHGIEDEVQLLRHVAAAASALGDRARPLLWKPHPVIAALPPEMAARLREEARSLGFEETVTGRSNAEVAAGVRWVITSPSTVSVDLLAEGILSIVLDPQHSLFDSTMTLFPGAVQPLDALAVLLQELDNDAEYAGAFEHTWHRVLPARAIDFASLLEA